MPTTSVAHGGGTLFSNGICCQAFFGILEYFLAKYSPPAH
jgi:hypothetical protein